MNMSITDIVISLVPILILICWVWYLARRIRNLEEYYSQVDGKAQKLHDMYSRLQSKELAQSVQSDMNALSRTQGEMDKKFSRAINEVVSQLISKSYKKTKKLEKLRSIL